MNLFTSVMSVSMIVVLLSLGVYILNDFIFKKNTKKIVIQKYISFFLGTISAIALLIFIVTFLFYIFWAMTIGVFSGMSRVLKIFNFSDELINYFSLTFVLIISAYVPEKFGYYFLYVLNLATGSKTSLQIHYRNLVKFLRLRLWVFFISFLLVFINSMEIIEGRELINNKTWIDFKPYIFQAVLSYMAFDRFIKLFSEERLKIKNDILKILNFIKQLRTKDKEN